MIKLTGRISDYRVSRESASFVFTESDQTKLGVVAIAAALAGMGGQAMSTTSNATALEEEADYVEFNLGEKIVKGWLWRSPFKNGDYVEVAAEWQIDHYETFGVCRPEDKILALYPHCSRAKTRHIKNALKWWLIITVIFETTLILSFATDGWDDFLRFWTKSFEEDGAWFLSGMAVAFGIAIFSMAKKWMPFVNLAEKVFKILNLPNASNLDLVKSSKNQRKNNDLPEFGSMYFRY
ncbi:putative type VI secretion system effector [Rugamonas rivuli]|uniref:putative type VI secretion system effector n=1 Tax=Rugamonas rivuli TaxID=2743358 RepID=UPI00128BB668|nr:putative type VI secretion system effector [Rugamonas rivuli]